MSEVVATASALVRMSIVSENRRLDVGVPASVPLVEVLPSFARSLGVLDPSLVHGGYELQRADGSALNASLSAIAQGVRDGDLLTLVRGSELSEPRVYDDVTEAVIDATSDLHRPWTARDNARTALAVSLTFLALCAVLLLSEGSEFRWGSIIAGAGAIVLLVASTVLGRLDQPESGNAFGVTSAAFAGLGGFLAVPSETVLGWPLAAAALGAIVFGGASYALNRRGGEIHLMPAVWGVAVGVPALVTGLSPSASVSAFVLMVATIGSIGNLLPWLALSSTRIRVISAQTDQEVFAEPSPIDAAGIKNRAAAGVRVLGALRLALGLAVMVAIPLVVEQGTAGAVLPALVFVGMMFQSRQAYARTMVLVVMALGAIGLALTALAASAAQPALRPTLLGVLIVATVVLVVVTLLSPRARLKLARVADSIEVLILVAVLPLGVFAAGWV